MVCDVDLGVFFRLNWGCIGTDDGQKVRDLVLNPEGCGGVHVSKVGVNVYLCTFMDGIVVYEFRRGRGRGVALTEVKMRTKVRIAW